jgi:hypothetical protein
VTGSALVAGYRDLVITLAERYKIPAIYYERSFVIAGGLMCYGPDVIDESEVHEWRGSTAFDANDPEPT